MSMSEVVDRASKICARVPFDYWANLKMIATKKKTTLEILMVKLIDAGLEYGRLRANSYKLLKQLIPNPILTIIELDGKIYGNKH